MLHWQWLIAIPNLGWNLKNLITFEPWVQTLCVASHWKATIYIYTSKSFQKFKNLLYSQKPTQSPKFWISIYGTHRPLGVKYLSVFSMHLDVFIVYLIVLVVYFNVIQCIYSIFQCIWKCLNVLECIWMYL
jgi:hypothetical protein